MTVPADLLDGSRYKHGTRARYSAGKCRCADCRAANTAYEKARQAKHKENAARFTAPTSATVAKPHGVYGVRSYRRACVGVNGQPCPYQSYLRKDSTGDLCNRCRGRLVPALVPADAAREHLRALQAQGIGYRSVADAADLPRSTIIKIARGDRRFIKAEGSRRILAVDASAAADHACVPAAETQRLLRELIREGYTRTRIAAQLGSQAKVPVLNFKGNRVLAKTELRVRRLHAMLLAEAPDEVEPIDESPRGRLLSALRWFESATLGELVDAIGAESAAAYEQALHRLWKAGEVERLGEKSYRYRLPQVAKRRAA